ncbi:MAG TPA: preprotein translocase subunit YajC [Vulgatibacter sp.]|nr:preprotein translocase subunit YajC [Vulgatibacter sp.]
MGGIVGLLPMVAIFAVMYFLMIRPQQKQAKKHREYLASLKKGDEVVTNSGIFGKIEAIEDSVVRLEIARDVKIRVLKTQIAGAQPGQAETVTAGTPVPAKKD